MKNTFNSSGTVQQGSISINGQAPVSVIQTIFINASSEMVWQVLSDINQWSTWLTFVEWANLNGRLHPGTTFDWKASGFKIHSTLHTVNKYSFIGWTGKVFGIKAIHNWELQRYHTGTEVICSESMQGIFVSLFKKSMEQKVVKDMKLSLELLKNECERRKGNKI